MADPKSVLDSQAEKIEALLDELESAPGKLDEAYAEHRALTAMEGQVLYRALGEDDIPGGAKLEAEGRKQHEKVQGLITKLDNASGDDAVSKAVAAYAKGVRDQIELDRDKVLPLVREHVDDERWQELGELMAINQR
jgi:hypothetical protein